MAHYPAGKLHTGAGRTGRTNKAVCSGIGEPETVTAFASKEISELQFGLARMVVHTNSQGIGLNGVPLDRSCR